MNDPTIRVPYCASCGTLASAGESFCRQCGKPVVAPTIAAQQMPPMSPPSQPGSRPQSTVTAVAPPMPQMPARPLNVGKKRRSPILLGCMVFLALIVVVVAASGIYLWRRSVYSAPERSAPAVPERAAGTMTEFPVDNDPNAPMTPESVQTEALGGTIAKTSTSTSTTKLPPGVDRSQLSKGATSMTTSVYRPKRTTPSTSPPSSKEEVYVCVLTAMPNQPNFGDGLANSIVKASGGQKTGVRITSAAGAIYVGSKIQAAESIVYVLTKQGADIVILIYSYDPSNSAVVDRLATNVGNGQGLIDYPEVKASLWTLPSSTPSGLTLVEINTITGQQIENSIASSSSSSNNDEVQKILSQMRPFIPDRLTGARYVDSSRGEWVTLTFEYGSTFAAWRTWLLARSALGLGGAESTDVREVNGVIMTQEGMRILVFQKGPYLIFVSSPSTAPKDRLVALGNQFQV